MIEIEHLSKKFGQHVAVDDISFTVSSGEILGFLGPNGAGKSTTMKMITGFLTPTQGRIAVCGHDLASNAIAAQREIGYLPEGAPLYGDMSVLSFLGFIARIRGLTSQYQHQRIKTVVEELELAEVLQQKIETLSKGFRRRVGIAQAILHDPKVLILDEPTDGLDPNQKHQVRNLIHHLSKDKIVVISTHILEEVSAVCTRAIIIARGKVVADGMPSELESRSRYHHAVTVCFTEPHHVAEQLQAQDEVAAVDVKDNGKVVTVFPATGCQVYPLVSDLIQQHNWSVAELHVERGRLDEVFRQITLEAA